MQLIVFAKVHFFTFAALIISSYMIKSPYLKFLFFTILALSTLLSVAQPPGGRPPGGGGRPPGGRPPFGGDRQWGQTEGNMPTVKQKKKVREGDTFRSLSAETGISARKLAKHNELNIDSPLHAGQVVWLKKKQSRAPKEYKRRPHVVAAGQSLYDISQMYGIRLKSLYKLNRLQPDYVPKVGDIIFVR